MEFHEIEHVVLEVLRETGGQYLLPYQVFTRLKERDPSLGQRIEREYPVQPGNPPMGEGAGIYYSPASFVAHALNHFRLNQNHRRHLDKRWLDTSGVEITGIVPGNKEGTSIWAWDPQS